MGYSPRDCKELDTTEQLTHISSKNIESVIKVSQKKKSLEPDGFMGKFCLTFKEVISCSVAKSCPTLCDPMDCSMPGFTVLHHLLEFAQIVFCIIVNFEHVICVQGF